MPKNIRLMTIAALATIVVTPPAFAKPVIPSAAGYGIDTAAGRGGKVVRITNLNDSGAGSLRACAEQSGPRYCVFEVSGTIKLASNLVIWNSNLTVAGQTAPSPGITIRGATVVIKASDVLVQHVAIRAGDDSGPEIEKRDALKINGAKNVVIDHCSISWAMDENLSIYNGWDNITVSNTLIAEPLRQPSSPKGKHGYSALIYDGNSNSKISFIGNLFAHGHNRNPRSSAANFVFANNVVYNPGHAALMLYNSNGVTTVNTVVGNVFIAGSDTSGTEIRLIGSNDGSGKNLFLSGSELYVEDNMGWSFTADPWSIVDNQSSAGLSSLRAFSMPVWPPDLKTLSAADGSVLKQVLGNAGARPKDRSSVDARIVNDVKNGSGRIIGCVSNNGKPECDQNAGGWPNLAKNTRSLSIPSDPNGDSDGDGYTNVEEWLHSMAAEVEGRAITDEDLAPPKPPTLQD